LGLDLAAGAAADHGSTAVAADAPLIICTAIPIPRTTALSSC